MSRDVYKTLSSVNVNEHTEKKNGLTYLSWAWAWGKLLEYYPDSTYTVYESGVTKFDGSDTIEVMGLNYFTDSKTAWVKTGVTVEGVELIEYLPVMDYRNKSIPLDELTSFDVNKAIQRSLTKAIARHGLGLYIYAGEDLPEPSEDEKQEKQQEAREREVLRNNLIHLYDNNPELAQMEVNLSKTIVTLADFIAWAKKDSSKGKFETFIDLYDRANEYLIKYTK